MVRRRSLAAPVILGLLLPASHGHPALVRPRARGIGRRSIALGPVHPAVCTVYTLGRSALLPPQVALASFLLVAPLFSARAAFAEGRMNAEPALGHRLAPPDLLPVRGHPRIAGRKSAREESVGLLV